MGAIREAELRRFVGGASKAMSAQSRKMSRIGSVTSVFLSHSSKDSDLAGMLKDALEKVDFRVYVDWLDGGMPDSVSVATATRIREKIVENSLFLLLSTNNALQSRWVPWELGFADGKKSSAKIGVFEVEREGEWYNGSEYVELYQKVTLPTSATRWQATYSSKQGAVSPVDLRAWLST